MEAEIYRGANSAQGVLIGFINRNGEVYAGGRDIYTAKYIGFINTYGEVFVGGPAPTPATYVGYIGGEGQLFTGKQGDPYSMRGVGFADRSGKIYMGGTDIYSGRVVGYTTSARPDLIYIGGAAMLLLFDLPVVQQALVARPKQTSALDARNLVTKPNTPPGTASLKPPEPASPATPATPEPTSGRKALRELLTGTGALKAPTGPLKPPPTGPLPKK